MSTCCYDFKATSESVTRGPNPILRPLDDCNNKAIYNGKVGSEFAYGVAFKPVVGVPNEVEPSLDGSDAIGVSGSELTATAEENRVEAIRTGKLFWSDIAENLGKDPASKSDWWAIHIAYAKLNIYVEFN